MFSFECVKVCLLLMAVNSINAQRQRSSCKKQTTTLHIMAHVVLQPGNIFLEFHYPFAIAWQPFTEHSHRIIES